MAELSPRRIDAVFPNKWCVGGGHHVLYTKQQNLLCLSGKSLGQQQPLLLKALEFSCTAIASSRDLSGDQGPVTLGTTEDRRVEHPVLVTLMTQTEDRKGLVKGLPQRHLLDVGLRRASFDLAQELTTTVACL